MHHCHLYGKHDYLIGMLTSAVRSASFAVDFFFSYVNDSVIRVWGTRDTASSYCLYAFIDLKNYINDDVRPRVPSRRLRHHIGISTHLPRSHHHIHRPYAPNAPHQSSQNAPPRRTMSIKTGTPTTLCNTLPSTRVQHRRPARRRGVERPHQDRRETMGDH
jgi:hypothetical protein